MTSVPEHALGAAPAARAIAPAKINAWLEVRGPRGDGYHEIETLMLALDLADSIEARASREPGLRLAVTGTAATDDVPRGSENLVWRAAEAVLERALALGRARAFSLGRAASAAGLDLRLEKSIPSQAGLGGGSSDAAAALLAARAALGAPIADAELLAIAAGLGSDCSFFLAAGASGAAICRGRGERVEPISATAPATPLGAGWSVALVVPEVRAPTAAVYRALRFPLSPAAAVPSLPLALFDAGEEEARAALFNRLERAACEAIPGLADWRALLDACGSSHFRLSGSGSAFFGLFRAESSARGALRAIEGAARERGLGLRGAWLTRASARGARLSS